jgi:F-type H+-transporting ATPase subunit alpha
VARPLKREFAQYKELLSLLKIRTKLSEEIEAKIKKGSALRDLFIQDRGNPNSLEKEIILFYAFNQELPQILDEAARKIIKEKLYPYIEENHADLIEELNSQKMLTGDITRQLDKVFNDFFRHYELE